MEIVFISKASGALGRFKLSWGTAVAITLVGVLAGAAVFFSGYQSGADNMANRVLNDSEFAATFWQRELMSQRKFLSDLRQEFDADLSAMSGKVGSLQAHIVRLDALSERLINVANLDAEEFRINETPAIGGPEPRIYDAPKWNTLLSNLQSLGEEISLREDRLDALDSLLMDRQLKQDMHPTGTPVEDAWMSSGFGYRTDPVSGSREFHSGVDFAGREGLEVISVAAGIVTWSGKRWGYGYLVEINHGNGYVTRYAHNKKNLVEIGDKVAKDQTIALLGSSGRSTGPHVHFEVLKDGHVVNPWKLIRQAAVK